MAPLPSTSAAIKKPTSITKPKTPPVAELVNNAIEKLNERKGSSLYAIKKYIENNNTNIDIKKLKFHIHKYLKKSVQNNIIKTNSQGNSLSGSFKMVKTTKATKDPADNKSKKTMEKPNKTVKNVDEKPKKNMNNSKTTKKNVKGEENGTSTDKVMTKKQPKQKVTKLATKKMPKKYDKNVTVTLEELNNSLLEKINKSRTTEVIKKKATPKVRKSLGKNQLKKMKASTVVRLPRAPKKRQD